MPKLSAQSRVDYICNRCHGNSVARDAWATWDAKAQDWVLGATFDHAHCHDCEDETSLVEINIKTGKPTDDYGAMLLEGRA